MSRLVELHAEGESPQIRQSVARDRRLEEWLQYEIEQALSARHAQEEVWREAKRQYAAIPRQPYKNTPVPNAPNIEVPLGAIATDAQYASITDTLYSATPILSARPQDEPWVEHAKAVQRWINYVAANEFGLRDATDHTFFDCCQLGTGVFHIPFVEDIYKHKVFNVRTRGPRILPISPENFLVPGGSRGDIQRDRWVAVRHWYMPDEMRLRARFRGWDITRAIPVASIDWVRRHHEHLNLTDSGSNWRELFEVFDVYAHFDYNGDGQDLDLLIHWDRTAFKVLESRFNPYDSRPFEPCRYQIRPHLFYGLGIMEMMRPFQEEASEVHNHRVLNMMIANARVWIALQGYVPESMEIWPNKVVEVRDINAIKELKMGEVYPSSLQAEMAVTALAERRVGMEGAPTAQKPHGIGTRTPGITAMSVAQAQNRRFTPAFDQMKMAAAGAVRQGLLRQRERLLAGDRQVEEHIIEVLGDKDAALVIDLLREPNFERYVQVEFTAVGPSVNREADRQNAILQGNMMRQYYTDITGLLTQLAQAAAQAPQIAQAMMPMVKQIVDKSSEAMDRLMRTFEQLRDPQRFLLNVDDTLDALAGASQQMQQQQGLQGITELLSGAGEGEAGGAGAPPLDTMAPGGTA